MDDNPRKYYNEWLSAREKQPEADSIAADGLSSDMFPHQRDLVIWALARGRSAIFADTGLGKTLMQLEWARVVSETRGRVLILAPLAVAEQTVREGMRFGIKSEYMRADDGATPIVVTNYEMLHHFNADEFAGVVLDESSILKNFTGKIRNTIINSFKMTPFRLACTATPAPNDHIELGNHAEFLGVKSRVEMLAEYFVHDGGSTQSWRIKGHARSVFWKWVCTWAAMVKRPSDMGYDDAGFDLPSLDESEINIPVNHADAKQVGRLFLDDARTLNDQRDIRKATRAARVSAIAQHVASEPSASAIV